MDKTIENILYSLFLAINRQTDCKRCSYDFLEHLSECLGLTACSLWRKKCNGKMVLFEQVKESIDSSSVINVPSKLLPSSAPYYLPTAAEKTGLSQELQLDSKDKIELYYKNNFLLVVASPPKGDLLQNIVGTDFEAVFNSLSLKLENCHSIKTLEQVIGEHHKVIEFNTLITSISSRFINLRFQNIDEEINKALSEIGLFTKVHNAIVYTIDPDSQKIAPSHQWTRKNNNLSFEKLQTAIEYIWENYTKKNKNFLLTDNKQTCTFPLEFFNQ